jgi:hypothetical protein
LLVGHPLPPLLLLVEVHPLRLLPVPLPAESCYSLCNVGQPRRVHTSQLPLQLSQQQLHLLCWQLHL